MTSVLRAIPYVIHRPVLRLIIMFFRVRVHYTRKTAAKVLLFFDMTKFFCKKIPKKCILCIIYRTFDRLSLLGSGKFVVEIRSKTFYEFSVLPPFILEGTRIAGRAEIFPQKNTYIFAYIRKMQYLCSGFEILSLL